MVSFPKIALVTAPRRSVTCGCRHVEHRLGGALQEKHNTIRSALALASHFSSLNPQLLGALQGSSESNLQSSAILILKPIKLQVFCSRTQSQPQSCLTQCKSKVVSRYTRHSRSSLTPSEARASWLQVAVVDCVIC